MVVVSHHSQVTICEKENLFRIRNLSSKNTSFFRKMLTKIIHFVEEKVFSEQLFLKGVGYRFALFNQQIQLSCGFSHSIFFPLPSGIFATVSKDQTKIFLFSFSKKKLSLFSAFIRSQRRLDSYKEKGCFSTKN